MRNARTTIPFLALVLGAAWFARSDEAAAAVGAVAQNDSPIRARQQVPDDPLAGLPSEDGARNEKAKAVPSARKNGGTCAIDGKPANARDVGDLRATLAVVQQGPRSWPCPTAEASGGTGLRITVEASGKITTAEPVGAASEVAAAIAKKLTGKSIAGRREGSTTGTVWLTFTPGKGR